MSSSGAKKSAGGPPQDLTRLAQRDIGKVAKLFRDSGFRYRVFDSETGEHQVVDPVRPLPPMDHVPPVWPPPLSDEDPSPRVASTPAPAARPRPAAPAPAASAAAAPAPAPAVPAPTPMPQPESSPAARRAEAETDRIFQAVARGDAAVSATVVPSAEPRRTAAETPRSQEAPMPATRPRPQSTARQVGRLVAVADARESQAAASPASAPVAGNERPFRGGGPTVGGVFTKLMQPPAPPAKPRPSSTAAVLRGLLEGPHADKK